MTKSLLIMRLHRVQLIRMDRKTLKLSSSNQY